MGLGSRLSQNDWSSPRMLKSLERRLEIATGWLVLGWPIL